MKKLLVLLISLIMVITLVGCQSPTEDTVTIEEYNELELRIDELENYISRMVWQGYLMPEESDYENLFGYKLGVTDILENDKDLVDETKFPAYIWDVDGNYINAKTLIDSLVLKYFNQTSNYSNVGTEFRFDIYGTELSNDDIIARLTLLILELEQYDFYLLDSSELLVVLNQGASSYFRITRMTILTTDNYTLTPDMFWEKLMDTEVEGFVYSIEEVTTLYDDYVTNETFTGYVLPNFE